MTEEIREKATFYFQDRLSKFCPADKNRPNEYEITMFIAGYQVAMDEASERIKKLREALEFYASKYNWDSGSDLVCNTIDNDDLEWIEYFVEGIDCSDDYGGKTARAALKEDDLKST